MKKHWKTILLIVLIVAALAVTRYIVMANVTPSNSDKNTDSDSGTQTGTKVLGSVTTAKFPSGSKLYANTNLNVRKGAGVTNEVLKTANAGTFIGTTTGTETLVETTTWVEVKLSDGTKAYVSKNFTYILS